jgi:hypothetical protein
MHDHDERRPRHHPWSQDARLQTLRIAQQRPEGLVVLRARTKVEHSLARVPLIRGGKERYKGLRETRSTRAGYRQPKNAPRVRTIAEPGRKQQQSDCRDEDRGSET